MARITGRQQRNKLDEPPFSKFGTRKVSRLSYIEIGEYRSMQMAVFALHEDGAGLFDHAVIVIHLFNTTGLAQRTSEQLVANGLIMKPFPSAAVYDDA